MSNNLAQIVLSTQNQKATNTKKLEEKQQTPTKAELNAFQAFQANGLKSSTTTSHTKATGSFGQLSSTNSSNNTNPFKLTN